MANSKEELSNFQRDGEIPCAPLGLIQSSRGQYCWWDRRSVFGEISQILSNISFTRGKNSPIPITLLLCGVEARNSLSHNVVDRTCTHSPENSTFRDLKLQRFLEIEVYTYKITITFYILRGGGDSSLQLRQINRNEKGLRRNEYKDRHISRRV